MRKVLTILIITISLQCFSQEWATVGTIWHYTQRTINPDISSYQTFESIAEDTVNGIPCKRIKVIDRHWGDTTVWHEYMYSDNDSDEVEKYIKNELVSYCENEFWISDRMGEGPVEIL